MIAPAMLAETRMAPRATFAAAPSLRYYRMQLALPQSELATLANVGRNTIVRLETGGTARLSTVRRLADALEVTPAQLMAQPPKTP